MLWIHPNYIKRASNWYLQMINYLSASHFQTKNVSRTSLKDCPNACQNTQTYKEVSLVDYCDQHNLPPYPLCNTRYHDLLPRKNNAPLHQFRVDSWNSQFLNKLKTLWVWFRDFFHAILDWLRNISSDDSMKIQLVGHKFKYLCIHCGWNYLVIRRTMCN
jgi:hypothetical protein